MTPGPWVIATDRISPPEIIAPGMHDVCVMSGAASNAGVMADARLIAAAPDLLEACQVALGTIELHVNPNGPSAQILRDAIAKATQSRDA